MARDTSRIRLTLERIRKLTPPDGKQAVYVFDDDPKHLSVRVTPAGAKSFVFAGKLNKVPLRVTIGDVSVWNLDDARAEARRLQALIDQGIDPRQEKAARKAEAEAKRAEEVRREVTFKAAWLDYVAERGPRWGERYREDHLYAIAGKDSPQPLASLVNDRLSDLTESRLAAWLAKESARRPTQAAGAFRKLRAFANWCAESKAYAGMVDPAVFSQKRVVEAVPSVKAKDDCLQREQLQVWFHEVSKQSPVQSAYLQILLLTGARREELAALRWDDVDFQWKSLRIKDKVEGARVIPLTPYVASLLQGLKARNNIPPPPYRLVRGKRVPNDLENWEPSPWVFTGRGETGRITKPNAAHDQSLAMAGLPHITLHGLRRSFGTLSEWCEVPVGVVAQIQGHKPSALAEKHYRRRPIDLLRSWHVKIEGWILEQAGIEQPSEEQTEGLRVVA